MTPLERAAALFEHAFTTAASSVRSAPGRVNIIGEHTDYNGGNVLPMALPQTTAVAVRLNETGHFRATSEQVNPGTVSSFDGPIALPTSHLDYLRGVCQVLKSIGARVPGLDVAIASDVPVGSGLSSSAALLVATLRAVTAALHRSVSDFELARLAHRAEHDYVGIRVGVMDPMACSLCRDGAALFLNSHTLKYELIPFPSSLELAVIDSGQQHEHASGEYGRRRRECETVAETLGLNRLCDLDTNLAIDLNNLSPTLRARLFHVLTENQRVSFAVAALRNADGKGLGALLNESHASLRDQYEVSTPEIDVLVKTAQNVPGCFGARITGGGFGGSIVLLTPRGEARRVADATVASFRIANPSSTARVVLPLALDGAPR